MENKRGISDVVATVLILLLAVVAVAILWGFLQPIFTKSGEKLKQAEACLSVNLEVISCTASGNATSVSVKRNPGAADLAEIKLIFEKPDGSTSVISKANVPDELGSVVYSETLGFKAKSASVAAGIADSKGIISYCTPTQPIVCG